MSRSFTALNKEKQRTVILALVGLAMIFVLLSVKLFFEGIVYLSMLVLGIIGMMAFHYFVIKSKVKASPEKSFYGVSKKPVRGILIGILFGIGFLLLTKVKFFGTVLSFALPSLPLSISGQAWTVIAVAPICEEIFFTMIVLSYLDLFLPLGIALILKGIAFSVSHTYAYVVLGSSSVPSIIGAFIGAGLFGIIAGYLGYKYGLEASVSSHSFMNSVNWINYAGLFSVAI